MRLYAFRGTRYRPVDGQPPDLGAPPFDQIDAAESRRLQARHPHHFAHLTRPAGDGDDAARAAAALHTRWAADGVVERDPEPALYGYRLLLAEGGSRLGICGLIGLEPPESGVVRPHERTVDKTIEERLGLLRATRIDLEPILLLADDDGAIDRLLAEDLDGAAPVAGHRDRFGHHHLLYRIGAADRVALYRRTLGERHALIADGHHRYRTAMTYAAELDGPARDGAGAKLAVLTSLASPGLAIDPIHRAWQRTVAPSERLRGVVARTPWEGEGGAALAAAVAAAPGPAAAVWTAGGRPEIWTLDPAAGPADLPAAASELPVVLLHHAVLADLGLAADEVFFRSDPEILYRQVAAGELAGGAWLPPMDPDRFAAAVADGDLLPAKSTRFLPKLASGLVWAEHRAQALGE